MSAEALQPKTIYEPVTKLEAFYTGGAVRVTRDHKHIACACGDEVKVCGTYTHKSSQHGSWTRFHISYQ